MSVDLNPAGNPSMFETTAIPALQEVLVFAQRRHELLAGNIANIDTPGYQTRDLSPEKFQEALKEALAAKQTGDELRPGTATHAGMHEVRDSLKHVLFHDGSDVDIERQVAEISKNQFLHNAAIALMTSQFKILEAAISERV